MITSPLAKRPTTIKIKHTIEELTVRLKDPAMKKPVNLPLREGYIEVIKILKDRRETYTGIEKLSSLRGQAIAMLGVDYLLGSITKDFLVGLSLK